MARANPALLAKRRKRYKSAGVGGNRPNTGVGGQQSFSPYDQFMGNLPDLLDPPALPSFETPPMGTFDPGLEAERRASQRGLADLLEDTARANWRARQDFGAERRIDRRGLRRDRTDLRQSYRTARRDTRLNRRQGLQDIRLRRGDERLSLSRALGDLAVARTRGSEDYDRELSNLQRQFRAAAQEDTERANRQGVLEGGTMAASDAVRAANQAYERGEIDLERLRDVEDLNRTEGRERQDSRRSMRRLGISERRLRGDAGRALTDLARQRRTSGRRLGQDFRLDRRIDRREFGRDKFDRMEQASRAVREQAAFEQDITQQEFFQANQFDPTLKFPFDSPTDLPEPQQPGNGRPPRPGVGPGSPVGPRQPRRMLAPRRRKVARRRPLVSPRY